MFLFASYLRLICVLSLVRAFVLHTRFVRALLLSLVLFALLAFSAAFVVVSVTGSLFVRVVRGYAGSIASLRFLRLLTCQFASV